LKIKSDYPVFLVFFSIIIVVNAVLIGSGSLKWGWEGVGIMIAAALTIALYSFLYHDNPLFKLAEHFYVGVAGAYLLIVNWYNTILLDIGIAFKDLLKEPLSSGAFFKMLAIILPTLLGLLIYTRLVPKISWMSRTTFAVLIGFGAGIAIPNYIVSHILNQVKPTMVPLWTSAGIEWSLIVVFVGVISTLVYFFFSVEHKGPVGAVAKLGIWFCMISFGASFGYKVMARISLLIGRVNFLFKDWIPLIK